MNTTLNDPGEYAPLREGEKAVIPLDTEDPAYNVWQTTRDDLMKGREPGPINIQRFPGGPENVFISFDIDVMDPAYTPGTGTPEPNGLTPRETFPLIRRLCAESNVVGFELVELLPYRVSGYETVLNSERIVRECLVGIAMRKKGIVDEHYLAPLTVDDERK